MTRKPNEDHVFYRNLNRWYPAVQRGEGIYLYDTEGKAYIDGSGGAVVAALGHGLREIEAAMQAQLVNVAFAHGSQFTSPPWPWLKS